MADVTWNEALAQEPPEQQPRQPSWEDAMKASEPSALSTTLKAARYAFTPTFFDTKESAAPANEAFREFFQHTAAGRIMSAFGHDAGDTLADIDKLQPSESMMKEQNPVLHGIDFGLIMPAATAADAAMRALSAPFMGAMGATEQALKEMGADSAAHEVGFFKENMPALPGMGMAAHTAGEAAFRSLPAPVARARSMGTIGEGEAGHFGLAEPTPEQAAARAAAETQGRAEAPDIHQVARQIAPEPFTTYDALNARQEAARAQLADMAERRKAAALEEVPHDAEKIAGMQAKIESLADEPEKAARLQKRLEGWLQENEDYVTRSTAGDSEEMAAIRRQIQEADYAKRDLAPQISAAYRAAQEQMPQESAQQPESALRVQPLDDSQRAAIVDDVARKLQAAGRPADEATAAAALVAEHYQARSQRFAGKLGTAEEMYKRDGAEIRAGKGKARARELAQSAKGKVRLATDDAKATITLMKSADASTFIHESGHHWLDELMRDSQSEHAPADLKADAETVRKWLGASGEIATRQHEKFARGFERYLMEGTAPSRQLAGVFAKFKQWLTQIYHTVDRLRSPINDDIRSVFDRLLSANPEKTVVAPENEPGKMLADIHEEDARSTPQEHAARVRDTIRAEINHTANLHDPEVYDALKAAESSARAEGVEGTPVGAEPDVAAGGAAGAQGADRQPPAVGDGGGVAGAAGEHPVPGRAGGHSAEADTPGTSTALGKPESRYVDKAGNIRLDNLNTPEDVNQVLRETAEDNGGFSAARRGVISDGQVLDLADALGMDPHTLSSRKLGQAFNAEQIIAARKLLIQSAIKVRDLMAKAATGTEDDVMAYAEAKTRHQMIQEQVSGITAEAGRALRAFRELEGSAEAKQLGEFLKQATGKDLFQLQEEARLGATLDTPQKISKFVNDSKGAQIKSMILEYYINALISGPVTHLRYSMGNALNALWTPLVEIPTAAGVGAVREALTGVHGDKVFLGEAGAQLSAIFKGSKEGLYAAAKAFKTGNSPALPGEAIPAQFLDRSNAIPGNLGKVINIPSKSVSAIHSFFKAIRYEQNLHGLAYREAAKAGLSGEEFANKMADLINSPSQDMMESATADALKELFMSPTEYNSTMGALNRAINSSLLAKIVVPFMKIGSQITRNAFVERTPLGFGSKSVRENIFAGGATSDFQLAKMATGVALMGGTVMLAAEGLATGDGPTDPRERAVWLLTHRPNTIQIGDITIPYRGLGHLGMLARFSANMYETAHGWHGEDGTKLAVSFLEGVSRSVLDENFMRGVKDMLDAVYHPQEYGGQYVKNFATNWLPFSVGMSQTAREIDPYQREAKSIMDAARAKIPFASEGLYPRRDMFGEPIPNSGQVQDYAKDPVALRMDALQIGVGRLERKIRGVELTDQQYDDFARIAGRMAKMRLNAMVPAPGFAQLPPAQQVEMIRKTIETSREAARSIVMMQNPQIMMQATQNKLKARTGGP